MSDFWYYAEGGETCGPVAFDELVKILSRLPNPRGVLVWQHGFGDWKAAENVSEIVAQLFRPPPLRPTSHGIARSEVGVPGATKSTGPASQEDSDTVKDYQQQFRQAPSVDHSAVTHYQTQFETPSEQSPNKRGRVAFLIVLTLVVVAGAFYTTTVYNNSINGIAYLVGQLATPWIVLTAITWKVRRSPYTASAVLAGAALFTCAANFGKLEQSISVREGMGALRGVTDPAKIGEALKQQPSNKFLQLIEIATKAAAETQATVDKLSDEVEPAALSRDINLVTASRRDLETLRRDLKAAETNALAFMSRYVAIQKAERDKVESNALALNVDRSMVVGLLSGVDKRHATSKGFTSKMMLARLEFYRAYERNIGVLVEEYGSYNVINDQFRFPLQQTADRYNVAASAMTTAAKRVSELEAEGKNLVQSNQERWSEFVKSQ